MVNDLTKSGPIESAVALTRTRNEISLDELLREIPGLTTNDVARAIQQRRLHADLDQPILEKDLFMLYSSREARIAALMAGQSKTIPPMSLGASLRRPRAVLPLPLRRQRAQAPLLVPRRHRRVHQPGMCPRRLITTKICRSDMPQNGCVPRLVE